MGYAFSCSMLHDEVVTRVASAASTSTTGSVSIRVCCGCMCRFRFGALNTVYFLRGICLLVTGSQ
jgi:hypothetical protein